MRPEKSGGQFVTNAVSAGNRCRFPRRRMDSKNILLMKEVSGISSCYRLKQVVERAHRPTSRSNSYLEVERMELCCNFSNLRFTQITRMFAVLQYHLALYSFTL